MLTEGHCFMDYVIRQQAQINLKSVKAAIHLCFAAYFKRFRKHYMGKADAVCYMILLVK